MNGHTKYKNILAQIREALDGYENNFHRFEGICQERFPDDPKARNTEMNRLASFEAGHLKINLENKIESISKIDWDTL